MPRRHRCCVPALIGYRAYRAAATAQTSGSYGFRAAAHLLAQVANAEGRRVFAFTRNGDLAAQDFARSLGAVWAGSSEEQPRSHWMPVIFAPPVRSWLPRCAATQGAGWCARNPQLSDIPASV
jgi:propanol-preferring alcohol dehydrogenase